MNEIYYLGVSIAISLVISGAIVCLSRVLIRRVLQTDKVQGYECGFQPFTTILVEFDVQFYIVALLFLLFDVELMLLFPWCVIFLSMPNMAFVVFVLFVFILFVGIFYEWSIGGLDFSS
jgi:NADH-quinone oxidoreductase subunit A